MKSLNASLTLALGLLIGTAPFSVAFPTTKDSATATLTFTLLPTVDGSGTSSGTVVIDVTRSGGVSTTAPLDVTVVGLVDGAYTVAANLKSDAGATPVAIGSLAVAAVPDPAATPLSLPVGLDPFDIAAITVSDATPKVVLSGTPAETIAKWTYMGNRPLTSPAALSRPEGHGPKPKAIKGHIVIMSRIVENVENKRKFLLVGQGFAPSTTYNINLDGVLAGTATSSKSGKLMLKNLAGEFRLAGTGLVTITTADGLNTVAAQADFFPEVP